MKWKSLAGLAALMLASLPVAFGQPSPQWDMFGTYQIPPAQDPIDALTVFVHRGATFSVSTSSLFNSYDTINYTNQGLMVGNPGFDFENIPTATGQTTWSANWVNQVSGLGTNSGVINCNGLFTFIITPQLPAGNLTGSSKCLVYASNIVNSGYINMSASSLIKMRGKNVDLSRGAVVMTNPSDFLGFFTAGQLDGYWGVGTADYRYFNPPPNNAGQASLLDPGLIFQNIVGGFEAVTDVYNITNRNSLPGVSELILVNPLVYTTSWVSNGGTNVNTQVAVIINTNNSFNVSVYFDPTEIGVQWQWSATNFPTAVITTNNFLTLLDDFGEVTNLQSGVNGAAGFRATYMPVTYGWLNNPFSAVNPFVPASPPVAPGQVPFIPGVVTNQYAAYQAIFTAGTQLPTDVAGGNVTNMAGRIEVTADTVLNLTNSRISSLNYLLLQATNHFIGSRGAIIGAPNMDAYLRTTNGSLAITNLVAPYLNHIEGTCDLWSGRWTNVVGTVTNAFHVLFVFSQIAPVTKPKIQTLWLNVTNFSGAPNNLVISDVLNVTSNLTLLSDNLTISTNLPNIFARSGELNILNPDIVWSTAIPNLMNFTNWGIVTAENAVYFGGSRTQPPWNTNIVDFPYNSFVNHGGISNQATLVWSTVFQNSGGFDCGQGSFILQQGCNVLLTNGLINAGGDISLTACSLFASNHMLLSQGALTLAVTNLLNDGSLASNSADAITNKNYWTAGYGIHLLNHPPQASLLGTTISNTAPDYALVLNQWAGNDVGNTPAGFANNAALGRLILQGNIGCNYEFAPVTGVNALYVDQLQFLGYVATNVDVSGNWLSAFCDPGMTVYFGQALANGRDISEKLNTVNDHRFQWVSNYNTGFWSSTNVVYTDGTTNRLNTALVRSCDIDSNGNGIPNCMDPNPIPVLSGAGLQLAVGMTNRPSPSALVSWLAFPGTSNTLYSASSSNPTNWTVVTNIVFSGPVPTRISVVDPVRTNGFRFYRVRAITR